MSRLNEFNDQLMGAPGGVLLLLAMIGLGYALKAWKSYPNAAIPITLVILGCGLWMITCPDRVIEKESLRTWWGRNILIGFIIPSCSWLLHRFALKRIERKLGGGEGFDTMELKKPNPPESKP